MRLIDTIVVHCADTPPRMDIGANEIRRWHVVDNGWSDIGYHYVIRRNGDIEDGRPVDIVGAHARGHNQNSIGICLVGGKAEDDRYGIAEANFTHRQYFALDTLINDLLVQHPIHSVVGHRDLDPGKECPCFNVKEFVGEI